MAYEEATEVVGKQEYNGRAEPGQSRDRMTIRDAEKELTDALESLDLTVSALEDKTSDLLRPSNEKMSLVDEIAEAVDGSNVQSWFLMHAVKVRKLTRRLRDIQERIDL